jgi:hypothetical protein
VNVRVHRVPSCPGCANALYIRSQGINLSKTCRSAGGQIKTSKQQVSRQVWTQQTHLCLYTYIKSVSATCMHITASIN